MPTLHEAQENMRKLVEQDQRNAEARRVYARHLLNEAAPELFEECARFVRIYDNGQEFDQRTLRTIANGMRAAIAKAKGQSVSPVTSEGKSE